MFKTFDKTRVIPSYTARDKWVRDFLPKKDINSIVEYKKIKDFFKTDCSEQEFKRLFPDYNYTKYICPTEYGIIPNLDQLKEMSIKLALLTESSAEDCLKALDDLYHFSESHWNYDKFIFLLGNYDHKAYINNKYKKVS